VIAAAARKVLETVDDEGFLADVASRGEELAEGLRGLGLDVRGRGLMLAFTVTEAIEPEEAPALARRLLLEQRLVVNATGPDTIRLLPPLTVSSDEVAEAVRRIRVAIG
jgi:acetylornithine/succinyldiaminopimelate/putrescine aminotransferase